MDITDTGIPSRLLQAFGQHPGIGQAILHDFAIAIEPEMDEVIILHYHLGARPREIKGERLLRAAQVVELEDEILWQICLVTPDDPAQSWGYQTVLMTWSKGSEWFHKC